MTREERRLLELEEAANSPWASLEAVYAYADEVNAQSRRMLDDLRAKEQQIITRKAQPTTVIHKIYVDKNHKGGREWIFSTPSRDRSDDEIVQSWELGPFNKNPVTPWMHDTSWIIGRWFGTGVRDGCLKGYLELVPKGISARTDEIISLVENGFITACSVGFTPLAREKIPDGGWRYTHNELLECSLVGVGCNRDALLSARSSLNVSDAVLKTIIPDYSNEADWDERQEKQWKARRAEVYKDLRPASVGYVECELDRLDKSISRDAQKAFNELGRIIGEEIGLAERDLRRYVKNELSTVKREVEQLRKVRGEVNAVLEFLGKKKQ